MIFLKKADFIELIIAQLSKYIKISMQTSSDSFYGAFFINKKEPGNSFQPR